MQIDVLIRLIAIIPRERSEALTTREICDRYYVRFGGEVNTTIKERSKMRRVGGYIAELRENGLVAIHDERSSGSRPDGKVSAEEERAARYHLKESKVLSYFLHSKVALSLLWSRPVTRHLGDALGTSDVDELARNARLNEQERVLRDGVRIAPDGVGRALAPIDDAVLRSAVEALESGLQLDTAYCDRSGRLTKRELTVLGLVAKDGTVYMVAVRGYDDAPRHLPLHRVKRAKVIKTRAFVRPDFKLDDYIEAQHQLAHVFADQESPVELELLVAEEALFHFQERPFLTTRGEQEISPKPVSGSWYSLKATVPNTVMLAPFLWSHAGWVQVIGPEPVRKRVAAGILAAASHYREHQGADSAEAPPKSA